MYSLDRDNIRLSPSVNILRKPCGMHLHIFALPVGPVAVYSVVVKCLSEWQTLSLALSTAQWLICSTIPLCFARDQTVRMYASPTWKYNAVPAQRGHGEKCPNDWLYGQLSA